MCMKKEADFSLNTLHSFGVTVFAHNKQQMKLQAAKQQHLGQCFVFILSQDDIFTIVPILSVCSPAPSFTFSARQ